MTRWQRNLLDVLFVMMEAIPWFAAITTVATIGERGYLAELSRELRLQISVLPLSDPDRANEVSRLLLEQSESATAGPALWAVLLAGFGGFWLMRSLNQLRLGGALGAIALVLASVFGLNILLHVIFAGDLLIWQNSGLATFIDNPDAFVANGADFQAVADRGGVIIGSATAIAMTVFGMTLVWFRFLHVGRRPIRFDQVLRSFSVGFAVILVSLMISRFNGIGQLAIYAVPFFMLGLLALAVANGERAALPDEGRARASAWGVSVTATLALLIVVASVFGLLAALDVTTILASLGGVLGVIVKWTLIIVLTPIFWLLVPILDFIIPDAIAQRLAELELPENFVEPEVLAEGQDEEDFIFPRWPFDVLKVIAFVALTWFAYRVGRSLLTRGASGDEEEFDEFRTDTSDGGSGLGGLLRGLLRRRSQTDGTGWLRLRPIYGVYGRTVVDAQDRGFERRHSDTPLEYSASSATVLEAPVFNEIAAAFDAARYGGHDADPEQVRRWAADVDAWEVEHPPTEELRDRLEQIRPPTEQREVDPAKEFAARVKRGREMAKRMRQRDVPGAGEGANQL